MKALILAPFLAGCLHTPTVELLRPNIPAALLRPCVEHVAAISTPRDLADAYVKRGLVLNCANGKIVALAKIVGPE